MSPAPPEKPLRRRMWLLVLAAALLLGWMALLVALAI